MRCAKENKALLECYKDASIFNLCTQENGAFWECYKRERVSVSVTVCENTPMLVHRTSSTNPLSW